MLSDMQSKTILAVLCTAVCLAMASAQQDLSVTKPMGVMTLSKNVLSK